MYRHQIVCHQVAGYVADASANAVDGDPVPVPHFGLAMSVDDFQELAERVRVIVTAITTTTKASEKAAIAT